MVRKGLGVTILYEMMLMGFESGVAVRPIREEPKRTITLGWRSSKTLPLAARRFSSTSSASWGSPSRQLLRHHATARKCHGRARVYLVMLHLQRTRAPAWDTLGPL